jgi:hypothetical protein
MYSVNLVEPVVAVGQGPDPFWFELRIKVNI